MRSPAQSLKRATARQLQHVAERETAIDTLLAQSDCNILRARAAAQLAVACAGGGVAAPNWPAIKQRAAARMMGDCPVCLTLLSGRLSVLLRSVWRQVFLERTSYVFV